MLDVITLIILALTTLIAFMRGFIKELFGFIGVILSFILTYYNYDLLTNIVGIKSRLVANIASTFFIYIIIIIAISIINSGIMHLMRPLRLGLVDRTLGIMIGVIKGLLFSFLFFMIVQLMYYTFSTDAENTEVEKVLPEWVLHSKVYKPFNYVEQNIDQILPEYIYENIQSFGTQLNNLIQPAQEEGKKDKKSEKMNKPSAK